MGCPGRERSVLATQCLLAVCVPIVDREHSWGFYLDILAAPSMLDPAWIGFGSRLAPWRDGVYIWPEMEMDD